jgi:hypothetical protein
MDLNGACAQDRNGSVKSASDDVPNELDMQHYLMMTTGAFLYEAKQTAYDERWTVW